VAGLLAERLIRDVPDFPKKGIVFKDVHPVMQDPQAFREAVGLMADVVRRSGSEAVVGIESRGFIFGAPIAVQLGLPFAMTRKLGKLPYDRITEEYALEYGTNTIEMHVDAIPAGTRAYIVDDLLATGGTAAAAARLIERLDCTVCGIGFLIELTYLQGRKALPGYPVNALIQY
jgi:adenine phosphoribosyltransferase